MLKLFGAALALVFVCLDVAAAPPQPIRDFIRRPAYSDAKISPKGDYLAVTVDQGESNVLTVLKTSDLSVVKVNQLPEGKAVGEFYWVGPERLMFNAIRKVGRFARPFGTGEWYGVNADGSQPRPLVFFGTRDVTQRGKQAHGSFSMLDTLTDDDVNVLMSVNYPRSDEGMGTEVVRFDTYSGRWTTVARAPRENCGIALDAKKQPRFAVCSDDEDAEGRFDYQSELHRLGDDGKWTLVNSSKSSGKTLRVYGSAADGRIYALQGDGKGTEAFGVIDQTTGEFIPSFHDPVSDVANYIHSADGETVLGVITEAGAPKVTMLDEQHPDAELYTSLAQAFPGQLVNFASATRDGGKIVVSVNSDRNPGELYLYDRASGKARFLMKGRHWIKAEDMASVKPFSLTTRDGLRIHGYLTIPKGSSGKNLPMIVNVHGGPMGPRDDWGFNWESQLFASRGYVVMQVNYRGSGGFGKAFMDQAYGQWGEGIMNDIIDATRWTIAQGYADANRVCIYGGSFGGYASMMAPIRDQSLFKCAFGYVGNYSPEIQMRLSDTSKRESGMRYLLRAYGSTKAEQDAMSPLVHADKIKLPVYLAAGARDPRCPPEHTEALAKALAAAGNPPEGVIIQAGEMHGFFKEENNLNLYTEMLRFFERHIGAAAGSSAAL